MLAAPPIHQLDGKYRLLAQLGQGGTADVSLAALRGPSGFSKLVVLKAMKQSLSGEPEFARMFMTEARLAARLNHPNIVQTNEVFEFEGLPVIVMEYLEGQPLSNVRVRDATRHKFTLAMHLRVLSDVLSGLQYSHDLKDYDGTRLEVVHRDVSPHNVFITFNGEVKLLDFGIAKLSGSHGDTSTGVIKGKLRYMPPEQVAAEGVDRRSDLYAVGVMLWEAATGMKMWHGMSDATVMNRILVGDLTRVRSLNPDVDPELETIIEKAMALEKADRYASAAEMRSAIEAYIESLGQAVHRRDIGAVIADLFANERQRTRRLVDDQLSKIASLSDAEYEKIQPVELTAFASVSGAVKGAGADQVQPERSKRRGRLMAVVGVVVLLFCVGILFGWKLFGQRETVVSASIPTVAAPPKAEVPARVSLRLTAFPANAKLYLAGELLPSNPVTEVLPRDMTRSVVLEATADGHRSEKRTIRLDRDWDIVVTLTPNAAHQAASASATTRSAKRGKPASRKPVSAVPPEKPRADCNPPYYVDERGVKKYKTSCL